MGRTGEGVGRGVVNRSKRKGTQFETDVVDYLRANGFPYAERRALRGTLDAGDIAGVVGWALEAKACKEFDLAGWAAEAEQEAKNAGARWWAVIAKRRMRPTGDAYVVMTLSQFCRFLCEEVPA